MRRRALRWLPHACLIGVGAVVAAAGCGSPAAVVVAEEDPALLQEILRRQEAPVAEARAHVSRLERDLRLAQMRRRMLERAGRHDLAADLGMEEHGLQAQLAGARRALTVTDEEHALAIYRQRGERAPSSP